jgi:hypothetical protein
MRQAFGKTGQIAFFAFEFFLIKVTFMIRMIAPGGQFGCRDSDIFSLLSSSSRHNYG